MPLKASSWSGIEMDRCRSSMSVSRTTCQKGLFSARILSKISCMESRAISLRLLFIIGGAQHAVEYPDALQGVLGDLLIRLHHRQGVPAPAVPVQAHVGDVDAADGELVQDAGQLPRHVLVADHQGVEDPGEADVNAVQPVHPDAAAAGGGRLEAELPAVRALHIQYRRVGVRLPQMGRVKTELQSAVLGDQKALGDPQVVRPHPQKARHQRPVRAVALAGLGKGPVEADVRTEHLLPQQCPGHAADPHGTRRMRAGGAHHDRSQDVKDIQHIRVPPGRSKIFISVPYLLRFRKEFSVDLSARLPYTGVRKMSERSVVPWPLCWYAGCKP